MRRYSLWSNPAVLPETCIQAVIESDLSSYLPPLGPEETVKYALANPHDTAELSVLAKGCKTLTVITSDHTRPMPSQITMPLLLQEIRKGNPDAQITILIATGCHRKTTLEELISIQKNKNKKAKIDAFIYSEYSCIVFNYICDLRKG